MGSATREALVAARAALAKVAGAQALTTGEQLFEAARVIAGSAQLRSALADPAADAKSKSALVERVFSSVAAPTRTLLTEIVSARWSSPDDLLAGIEEIGIRAVASSHEDTSTVSAELFAFEEAVSSDPELELAVGSKLGAPESKSALVRTLLEGSASPQTVAIVDHLVQLPRGRRIGELIRHAAAIVADQAGLAVAVVVTATPLTEAQLERLRAGLAKTYGRELDLHVRLDSSIIGGIRVQIGDDVIDGSVLTRLNDLKLRLAS